MIVNGENFDFSLLKEKHTLEALIEVRGLSPLRVAIELNGEIIARSEYKNTPVHEGDAIEIIHYVGGG